MEASVLTLALLAEALVSTSSAPAASAARVAEGLRRQIDIEAAAGHQHSPAVAFNSVQNEFLVLWVEDAPPSVRARLLSRRPPLERSPEAADPLLLVTPAAGFLARVPSAAFNATDNTYLVVWEESDLLEEVGTIVGLRIAADGTPLGGAFRIDAGPCVDDDPSVAWNSQANEWMVVWHEDDSAACDGTLDGINGRVVDAGGTAGAVFNVSPDSAVPADEPQLSYDSVNDEYLAVYERQDGTPTVQLGQRLSPSGTPLGGELTIAADPEVFQEDSSVAFNPETGTHLVAWQLRLTVLNTTEFVLARLVTGGTGALGPIFVVSDGETDGNHPAVAFNPASGQFLVAFEDRRDPIPFLDDIRGQWVNGDGSLFGGNFVIGARAGSQDAPEEVHRNAACGTDGGCLVIWADDAPETDDDDIAGRIVFPVPAAAKVSP
jgi:hypothetical protein